MDILTIFIRILLFSNGIIIFFFFQVIVYGLFSYLYHFNQKKKLNFTLDKIEKIAKDKSQNLPLITIVIPAKDEYAIIGKVIDKFISLNYPKDRFSLLLILDDKEILTKPFEETTHYIVQQKQQYYNKLYNRDIIILTSVPVGFDGEYNGKILKTPVNSTKPRALNWGLKFIPANTQIIGFFDADAHPEQDTLLFVAYRYLTKKDNENLLLQGPVVQVRNYFSLKPFNKIYAIAQAITHEWYLPALLAYLPFIGGTNFFVEPKLLHKIKGFNKKSLSEDLEIGCRLFIETNTWPEFMPYVATEQTPPTYKDYFRQRVRWASGYIQVLKDMLTKEKYILKRFFVIVMLLFYGILPWIATQIVTFVTIGLTIFFITGLSQFYEFLPYYVKFLIFAMNICYAFFLIYYFNSTIRKIVPEMLFNRGNKKKIITEYLTFLLIPIAATLGVLPYTYGFIVSIFTKNIMWEKTVRTRE